MQWKNSFYWQFFKKSSNFVNRICKQVYEKEYWFLAFVNKLWHRTQNNIFTSLLRPQYGIQKPQSITINPTGQSLPSYINVPHRGSYCLLKSKSYIWNSSHKHLIWGIEIVQWRCTKRIPIVYRLPYADCLACLNLDILELRHLQTDLITEKILNNSTPFNSNF